MSDVVRYLCAGSSCLFAYMTLRTFLYMETRLRGVFRCIMILRVRVVRLVQFVRPQF